MHTKVDLERLLENLAPVVYPALREEYTPDCCIAAASILTAVFKRFGYRAETVPVSVECYNPVLVKMLERGITIPEDRQQRDTWFAITGAWGVGILRQFAGNGYGGHLILRVGGWLVDATIQQMERPAKKIELPPMLYVPHAHTFATAGRLALLVNGCRIVYRPIADESYRTAPDWRRRSSPYPETIRRIMQKVRTP